MRSLCAFPLTTSGISWSSWRLACEQAPVGDSRVQSRRANSHSLTRRIFFSDLAGSLFAGYMTLCVWNKADLSSDVLCVLSILSSICIECKQHVVMWRRTTRLIPWLISNVSYTLQRIVTDSEDIFLNTLSLMRNALYISWNSAIINFSEKSEPTLRFKRHPSTRSHAQLWEINRSLVQYCVNESTVSTTGLIMSTFFCNGIITTPICDSSDILFCCLFYSAAVLVFSPGCQPIA